MSALKHTLMATAAYFCTPNAWSPSKAAEQCGVDQIIPQAWLSASQPKRSAKAYPSSPTVT